VGAAVQGQGHYRCWVIDMNMTGHMGRLVLTFLDDNKVIKNKSLVCKGLGTRQQILMNRKKLGNLRLIDIVIYISMIQSLVMPL